MTLYQFFNRICEGISRVSPVLLLTPYPRNIGNCAEEMYYGLLEARRVGKKALFLFPRGLVWKFRLEVANRELLELQSDHALRNDGLWCRLIGGFLTLAFVCLGRCYLHGRQLVGALKRRWPAVPLAPRNNIYYVVPSVGRSGLWQLPGVKGFSFESANTRRWCEQYDQYLPVRLAPDKRERAERCRVRLGIPLDRWYVCLHVREGGFRDDSVLAAPRHASIASYLDGIRAITQAGGFVVRLGDPSMTRLPAMERVIDYAYSPLKSALMDIYLLSECRFFVGVNSGPLDIAWLFQKCAVLTNLTEWTLSFAKRRRDRAIIKHIFSRSRNRFLSLQEILEEPFECQFIHSLGKDYAMVENTPEEIREVIVEFLSAPPERALSPLQEAFNEGRRVQIRRWLERSDALVSGNPLDDATERYRFASRIDGFAGALGQRYVEENWLRDSMQGLPQLVCGS